MFDGKLFGNRKREGLFAGRVYQPAAVLDGFLKGGGELLIALGLRQC